MATDKPLSILATPTGFATEVFPGIAARVWKGSTAEGTPVALLVVAVMARGQSDELERTLSSNPEVEAELEVVSASDVFHRVFTN